MGKRRWKKEGTTGCGKVKLEEGRNNWLWERAVGKNEQEGVEIFSIFNYRCSVIPAQSIYYLNIYYK